jgi:hypothetical protein
MKLLTAIIGFIFALSLFFSPTGIHAAGDPEASGSAQTVDVYSLFWPIVPGKTVADSMFWVKQLKETFSGMFSFGNVNKSKYQIDLSEKRLVEAYKLIQDKDYANAQKSLDLNKAARDEALKLKKKAIEEKADALELTNRLVKSLENQEKALMFLATQLPDDQKAKIQGFLKDLPLQISEAK